jgi:asparagine synthase (glutamine-hydrolysing)
VRFPGLTDLLADDAGRGTRAPTVIVAPDRPGVLGAVERDGSFLTLVGAILDDTTPGELLSLWIERREDALTEVPFHGFVAAFHAPSNEAMLARDKYGVRIGYFARIPGGVAFSDDIAALILCGADPSPHPEALDAFLTSGYFPAPLTPYRAVSKLVPGHAVGVANGEVAASRPWASYRTLDPVPVDEASVAMRTLLADAIGRLVSTDGEAALLLSGGIDSAMVAVGITRYVGASVRAYTFRYDEYEGDLNEGSAARATAEILGIPHEEIVVGPQNVIDDLDDAVGAYGEPFT